VTRLLERGAAFATVATVMGWSAATAMRMAKRYGHIGKSAQRDALALLDPAPVNASATASTSQESSRANFVGTHPTVQ
jgi:hypothetical protein